jgi:gliding motility-associated-like protein
VNTFVLAVEFNGELVIHNAVAPASTGDNKFMRIFNLPDEVSNKVSIYNRWGDNVFSLEGYNNEVQGKRFEGFGQDGRQLPSGTYFYKIELSDRSQAVTGYLSLKW